MLPLSRPSLIRLRYLRTKTDSKDPPNPQNVFSSDTSPSIYLEKMNRSGWVWPGDIEPKELLTSSYRNQRWRDNVAEMIAYWFVKFTKDEGWGKAIMATAKKLGAFPEKEAFFRFKPMPFPPDQVHAVSHELKNEALNKMKSISENGKPKLHVLLTGGTGFLGLDLLQFLSVDPNIVKMYIVVWHKEVGTLSMEDFKIKTLKRLDIPESTHHKFEFVKGDVTQTNMGLSDSDVERFKTIITHMVHLAASVSFEDPYDKMYRANVQATQKCLDFAYSLQTAPNSKFVNLISTETCYIHGRNFDLCREDQLVFPRDYYNNYYEVTKAIADIQAHLYMMTNRLRVISLCPAITIGHSRTGNNHGDTKVINAAGNAFGRIAEELDKQPEPIRTLARRLVMAFPASQPARIGVVSVDRITEGLAAALYKPLATGERIHITGDGLPAGAFASIFYEETGVKIGFVNPVLHRKIRRPILKLMFKLIKQDKLYSRLELLFDIFGSYAEWGQPVHQLGNDVRLLGLTEKRPDLYLLARVLIRHNYHVQNWGRIRDPLEIARREKIWKKFIHDLEVKYGSHAGEIPPDKFKSELQNLKL